MAFKEVSDLSADVTISLGGTNRKSGKPNPNSVEGYYLGKREVADKKKKSGKSYIYFFQTPKGNIGVWGKTDLDRKMGSVELGAMTKVSFDRMVATPNGEMYKYKVARDPDNRIEVDAAEASAPSIEDEVGSDLEDLEGLEESLDEEEEVLPPPRPSLSAAERQAKVAALLSKKR